MIKLVELFLLLVLFVLSTGYSWSAYHLNYSLKKQNNRFKIRFLLLNFYLYILLLGEKIIGFPLPLFYLLFWGYLFLLLYNWKENPSGSWMEINIRFIYMATEHLIILGCISLIRGCNVMCTLESSFWRDVSISLTLVLNIISNLIFVKNNNKIAMRNVEEVYGELFMMSVFIWFGTIFTILQSIPCLYDLPATLTSMFLVGSNLLMLMLLSLFSKHSVTILKKRYLEEEYLRLAQIRREAELRKARLEENVFIDNLTKAVTRRRAEEIIDSFIKNDICFSVAFLDLDRLKEINDREGHNQGDLYLVDFSRRFRAYLRNNDVFARIGGDEFIAIMPECGEADAHNRVLEIRKALSLNGPEGRSIPFSFGISSWSKNCDILPEDILSIADRFMYEDKQMRKKQGVSDQTNSSYSKGDPDT